MKLEFSGCWPFGVNTFFYAPDTAIYLKHSKRGIDKNGR